MLWQFDPAHSQIQFSVKHMGISTVRGTFQAFTGEIDEQNGQVKSVTVDIDMTSLTTANEQRDGHLKSPDFFNTKQFPSITFKSKECRKSGEGFDLVGDMTLLGKTMPVTAKLTHIGEGDRGERMGYRSGVEATFTFKRSDFGMNYGIKGDALGDEVMVVVALEGQRQ